VVHLVGSPPVAVDEKDTLWNIARCDRAPHAALRAGPKAARRRSMTVQKARQLATVPLEQFAVTDVSTHYIIRNLLGAAAACVCHDAHTHVCEANLHGGVDSVFSQYREASAALADGAKVRLASRNALSAHG
jgi:hypothetical protein